MYIHTFKSQKSESTSVFDNLINSKICQKKLIFGTFLGTNKRKERYEYRSTLANTWRLM